MNAEELKPYLERDVGVGIPHWQEKYKLFYFYGTVKKITENYILLKIPSGLKEIPIDEIKQIFLKNNVWFIHNNKEGR